MIAMELLFEVKNLAGYRKCSFGTKPEASREEIPKSLLSGFFHLEPQERGVAQSKTLVQNS